MKAIQLYIQYNRSSAAVIRELGYPSRKLLPRWYKQYREELQTSVVWDSNREKYSKQQQEIAVNYYAEHGRNASKTVKTLGYPSREILKKWCEESGLEIRKRRTNGLQYSPEQKQKMVIDLCTRKQESAAKVATVNGVTRDDLYNWKKKLLGKGYSSIMPKKESKSTAKADSTDKEALVSEIEELKNQIEKMILDKATEIVKKEMSIDVEALTNKEKTMVIDALTTKVSLAILLHYTNIPRSRYLYRSST